MPIGIISIVPTDTKSGDVSATASNSDMLRREKQANGAQRSEPIGGHAEAAGA